MCKMIVDLEKLVKRQKFTVLYLFFFLIKLFCILRKGIGNTNFFIKPLVPAKGLTNFAIS